MYLKDPIIYMELHEDINGGFKCIYFNLQVIAIMPGNNVYSCKIAR